MTKRFHCPFMPFKPRDGEVEPTCSAHHSFCRKSECLDYLKTEQKAKVQDDEVRDVCRIE